ITEFSKRDNEFKELNAVVLGCSTDSKHSHKAWINGSLGKLSHALLADYNKTISKAYDCLDDESGHAQRATFIIDPKGVVQHASYNSDHLGRSVSAAIRILAALETGERCPVEWKPGQKTLGKPA